jgi:hypothetical protein
MWRENARYGRSLYVVSIIPLPPEKVSNRIHAGAQLVVGAAEEVAGAILIVSPEPAATKVGGGALVLHGCDKIYTYALVMKSGELRPTTLNRLTAYGAKNMLGMDPGAAQLTGAVVDMGADVAAFGSTASVFIALPGHPFLQPPGTQIVLQNTVANPMGIRYIQATASPNMSTGGYTIQSTLEELIAGNSASSIPTIRVVGYDGRLWTLDHRRLVSFKAAGLNEIPIRRLSLSDPAVAADFWGKLKPINGGRMIVIAPNADRAAAEALLRQMGKIK